MNIKHESTHSFRSMNMYFVADGIGIFADVTQYNKLSVSGENVETIVSKCSMRGYRNGEKLFEHEFGMTNHDYGTFITAIYCGQPVSACTVLIDNVKEFINEPSNLYI